MELMLKYFGLLDKYFDDLGRNSFFAVWFEPLMVNTMAMVMMLVLVLVLVMVMVMSFRY